jgi:hypothetical protein
MCPTFHHHPPVNHINHIRLLDRAQPMRHRDRRPPPSRSIQCGLDYLLGFGVEGRGGFVEEEDLGVPEEGARDGDTLLLPAGEEGGFAADLGFKSVARKKKIGSAT